MFTDGIAVILAVVAWLSILWAVRLLRHVNRSTSRTWVFIILFAVSITSQVGLVYDFINGLIGINHVAWLISYSAGAIGVHIVIATLYDSLNLGSMPRPLRYGLWVTILLLISIFPLIAGEPAGVQDAPPTSIPLLLFRVVGYLYMGSACFVLFALFNRLQRRDAVLHTRVRWLILAGVVLIGAAFFSIRVPYFISIFVYPTWGLSPTGEAVYRLTKLLEFSAVGWAAFFLPARYFRVISTPVVWLDKVLTLRDLQRLQAQIENVSTPVVAAVGAGQHWWQTVRNLDFYLYRTIIAILDGKKAILYMVEQEGNAVKEIVVLHDLLSNVQDNDVDFQTLVTTYRDVSRSHRKSNQSDTSGLGLANWVAQIFHPAIISTSAIFLVMWLSGVGFWAAAGWMALFVSFVIVPLLAFIACHVRAGRYSDWDISIREQRHNAFILVGACVLLLVVVLHVAAAPAIFINTLYAVILANAIGGVINLRTKVSLHAIATTGAAAILLPVSPLATVVMGGIALLVGWSRIRLGHHTTTQVIMGSAVSIICVWLVFTVNGVILI